VSDINRLTEHQGAAPDDALDTARVALSNRFLGHAAVAKGPMEPDLADAVVAALSYDLR
jgi:hypothetical protein